MIKQTPKQSTGMTSNVKSDENPMLTYLRSRSRKSVTVPKELEQLPSAWKREYVAHGGNQGVFKYWRNNANK